jgi:hypothetical protein
LKIAIEIVDLPSYKMVISHSFLYVYQRVLFRGKPCSYSLEMIEGNGKLAGKCLIILIYFNLFGW